MMSWYAWHSWFYFVFGFLHLHFESYFGTWLILLLYFYSGLHGSSGLVFSSLRVCLILSFPLLVIVFFGSWFTPCFPALHTLGLASHELESSPPNHYLYNVYDRRVEVVLL